MACKCKASGRERIKEERELTKRKRRLMGHRDPPNKETPPYILNTAKMRDAMFIQRFCDPWPTDPRAQAVKLKEMADRMEKSIQAGAISEIDSQKLAAKQAKKQNRSSTGGGAGSKGKVKETDLLHQPLRVQQILGGR